MGRATSDLTADNFSDAEYPHGHDNSAVGVQKWEYMNVYQDIFQWVSECYGIFVFGFVHVSEFWSCSFSYKAECVTFKLQAITLPARLYCRRMPVVFVTNNLSGFTLECMYRIN